MLLKKSEWVGVGGPHFGSHLKVYYFVGCQLYFSPVVASKLNPLILDPLITVCFSAVNRFQPGS